LNERKQQHMNPMSIRSRKSTHPSSPAAPPLRSRVRPQTASEPDPPAPAPPPSKPRAHPERVEEPRRLRAGRQTRRIPGVFIANNRWGSPFRPREVEGRWFVVWTGGEMELEDLRPPDWQGRALPGSPGSGPDCSLRVRELAPESSHGRGPAPRQRGPEGTEFDLSLPA
jgi:hypothetical protein